MLTWNWKEKIGEFKVPGITDEEWKGTLYKGNALLIFLLETNNKAHLYCFFGDEEHAKNCLGITKGTNNFLEGELEEVTIYSDKTDGKYRKKILGLLAKGFKNLTIKIRKSEGSKDEKEEQAYDIEAVTIHSDKTDGEYRKKLVCTLVEGSENLKIKIKESEEN